MDNERSFLVVVGVDGSPESIAALRWAVDEARLRHGRVRPITSWSYPPRTADVEGEYIDDRSERGAERIQAVALDAVPFEGVDVTGHIVQGPPASVLLDAANGADLLVVGSRGLGGFSGLLLGSVSNQLVHHAPCPVLVIRS
ncbi:nucleotide-binding universal stress UspA family protein [Cryobacterium sp. MP_M5]|uniref:universal stress protein n=1 Tax=unclassified Cryobacterium TaxID=2649013 RepID=UPI0018CAE94B|nr:MULTISPECIES: universal stress protein [unclassified Cryobacterium]MBG6058115.1 nucleotide-binding universal stress UspA family protein [Cryobacterium sp. MP_M3]MEC5176641.1 nucleotide-binding universal stress UspA family protein [Cryobacterium sp. MP_M5]